MKQYVCIKEGTIEILNEDQIGEKTRNGEFYQTYFELGREMQLMIKLIPKKDTPVSSKKKSESKS